MTDETFEPAADPEPVAVDADAAPAEPAAAADGGEELLTATVVRSEVAGAAADVADAPGAAAKPKKAKGKGKKKKKPKPALDDATLVAPVLVLPAAPAVVAGGRSARRLLVAAVVAAAVAVGLTVAFVLAMLRIGDDTSLDGARTSALASARTYALDLASYDYRHLQADFAVVTAHSTPTFSKSYQASSSALESTLTKFHATATAKIVAEGMVSWSTSQATVLVFLDQTVTNSTQKAPTVDRSQLEIVLDWSGGSWLINQVTLL